MKFIFILLFTLSTARADCWNYAAKMFNISPELLYAIAQQESALNPNAVGRNHNGSEDLGLMQINTLHLPRLSKLGISREQLNDPCTSIMVGASILADMMKRYGYSWEAVGAYNAGTAPDRRDMRLRYAKKIHNRYRKLKQEN
ncbi:type III secretion system invasion protein IagB [Serratia proteamaculans]|uniref:type III secretion system invasion protein IagB n=1 Tax=Serratia proteamaculans TaxID=28151 RepID=UPI0010761C58|nr:type III secretion system invasion protein IagB [Serratia proteamaculans]TFZ48669.1 type III secretion system invasion protein IagB [Serratia proteamaculans]